MDRLNLQTRPKVYHYLKNAMYDAVNTSDGTGWRARVQEAGVCGKTGTAQNPRGEPHAWFAGYAPMNAPRLAIVVMLENGGSGGAVAAPIAGQLFRYFFNAQKIS